MMNLQNIAAAAGFDCCYLLPLMRYEHYQRRLLDGVLHPKGRRLCFDPAAEFPWANGLLFLIWPYAPLKQEARIAGYYLASNASFHAAMRVIDALAEAGVRAEKSAVPVRESAMAFGLGRACHNGLTAFPGCGTRAAVQTLALHLPQPVYSDYPLPPSNAEDPDCALCRACEKACPADAIDESGFHFDRCLRAHMAEGELTQEVMERMPSLIGCENCQYACPKNRDVPIQAGIPEALALEPLLRGEVDAALALLGKNQNAGGLLTAHAAVMAGNLGRSDLLPLIEPLRMDERPMIRAGAEYAISRLRER